MEVATSGCPTVDEVNAYRRKELAEDKRQAMGLHLQRCARCYQQLFFLDCFEDDGF